MPSVILFSNAPCTALLTKLYLWTDLWTDCCNQGSECVVHNGWSIRGFHTAQSAQRCSARTDCIPGQTSPDQQESWPCILAHSCVSPPGSGTHRVGSAGSATGHWGNGSESHCLLVYSIPQLQTTQGASRGMLNNSNRTEWSPIQSVIIPSDNKVRWPRS